MIAGREGIIDILMVAIQHFGDDVALQIRACVAIQTLSLGGILNHM